MSDCIQCKQREGEIRRLAIESGNKSDEIERLQRDLEIWRRNGGDDLMRAEIKRLKALSQNNAHSWDAIVRERDELREALSFARSVIKSGEPWTDECERRLALESIGALDAATDLTQKIKDEIEGWCDGHQFQVIWKDDADFNFESLRLTVQGEEALRKLLDRSGRRALGIGALDAATEPEGDQ